ncbi:hypothetical protein E2C01_032021 [Portunus trituberculatus]|uniref:Uncharacterized protein n=1 Tax=Portunus trituberculatus TaxID=210409 RepID=A0A5B7F1P2_PORTR|nr:hypothetical protein [Portunus trituberculatus]
MMTEGVSSAASPVTSHPRAKTKDTAREPEDVLLNSQETSDAGPLRSLHPPPRVPHDFVPYAG